MRLVIEKQLVTDTRLVPQLPAELQVAIREEAARGPAGIELKPFAPLYAMRLILAIERLERLGGRANWVCSHPGEQQIIFRPV